MKSKFYIQEFNPQIYPRKLWIAKGGTFEDITALFMSQSGKELICSGNCLAVTYEVREKRNNYLGQLIWFPKIKYMTISTITHEAFHAASDLFCAIGCLMDYDNQEPFAYLVGWIADCADKVKKIIK